MCIGLIPRFDLEIVTSLGNAASTGASMVLLSQDYWQMANPKIAIENLCSILRVEKCTAWRFLALSPL
jgi:uncharacterized 2Fe-2S/4Fe-4S cluster protein (DUF4445 family)